MPAPHRNRNLIVLLLLVVGAAAAVALLVNGHHVKHEPPAALTVPVDGLDAGTADDRTIVVPKAAVEQAAPELESGLREAPANVPPAQLDAIQEGEQRNRDTTEALPTAGATAGFAGCRTSFVNNQSSRRGVRPTTLWDHYTVSPNRPGWSDVDAVVALFNRTSSQASSHFVIDSEGHCAYIVPIEAKSWTEAGANAFAVGFEIIATGHEKRYLEPAGMRKLAQVQAAVAHRIGITLQRGAVRNCVPTRPGIVEHRDGGLCAGGHVDITPFSIASVVAETIKLAGGSTACNRACDLRRRNRATHTDLKRLGCKPASPASGGRCLMLHRRHHAIHVAARKARVRL